MNVQTDLMKLAALYLLAFVVVICGSLSMFYLIGLLAGGRF